MDAELDKLAGKTDVPSIKTPDKPTVDEDGEELPQVEPEAQAEPEKDELKPDASELEKQISQEKRDRKAKAWPLVDKWRKIALETEKQLVELKSKPAAESPDVKPLNEKLTSATQELETVRKQLQEAHEELKHVAYERSPDFKDQYIKPYEEAWTRAITDLKGLQVTLADGTNREIAWQDVQALANMEPDVRRKTIKEQFPDDVQEVTGHVKSIRELADKQKQALETFRKEGDTRAQQKVQTSQKMVEALTSEVVKAWTAANAEAPKHEKYGKYFSPIEGDDEGNTLLDNGYKRADEAFSSNPLDPRLTPQQRAEIVRKQAAQRNRSAAFSRLVRMNEKKDTEIAELKAKLEEFSGSEPGNGNGKPAVDQTPARPMDRFMGAIDRLAR